MRQTIEQIRTPDTYRINELLIPHLQSGHSIWGGGADCRRIDDKYIVHYLWSDEYSTEWQTKVFSEAGEAIAFYLYKAGGSTTISIDVEQDEKNTLYPSGEIFIHTFKLNYSHSVYTQ